MYWYCQNDVFIFASEIKAILKHPRVSATVCYPALNEYFTFQNIFSDLTMFNDIRLLPPACTLTLDLTASATPRLRCYWDYSFLAEPLTLSEKECSEQLYHLFVEAVTRQLISDVPVGSYLSGGMDSGSITAVAVRHLKRLTTFTGGFDLTSASGLEVAFDERRSAEIMANLFKTEHYEMVMHAGDMEWVFRAHLASGGLTSRPVLP
ncbi:MAG: asparagine synthase-related protein [Anaerolineae bacterium]